MGPEVEAGVVVEISSLNLESTATGEVSVEGYVTKADGQDLDVQLDLIIVARSIFGDELDRRSRWAKLRTVGDKSWFSLWLNPDGDRITALAFLFEEPGAAVVCPACGGLVDPRDADGCEDCNFTAAMRRRRRGR